MSVVDVPPGRDFEGPTLGEFRSRPGPYRLARIAFYLSLVDAGITYVLLYRNRFGPQASTLAVLTLVCVSVAGVGFAVRRARVRIDAGGIRWGWAALGGRIGPARIKALHYYEKGMTVIRTTGSPWYISGYDWAPYGDIPKVCADAGLPLVRRPGAPPLRARMQAYGVALDVLVICTLVASGLQVAITAFR